MSEAYLYQINVTRDCNLRCTHCYIHSDVKKASKKMSKEHLIDLMVGIDEHMREIGRNKAEIHIVGGEPTMLGVEYFREVMPGVRSVFEDAPYGVELSLVSNLLNPDIVEIALMFDRISTSYEPETRFPKQKLEDSWVRAVSDLRDAGIAVGITTAITKPVIGLGVDALLGSYVDYGFHDMHFGFFIPEGDGLINQLMVSPSFAETSSFLIELTDWYLARRDQFNLNINPIESMLTAAYEDRPVDDIVCPIIAGSMDVNWDGNTLTCIEEGGGLEPMWLGNVFEASVSEVASSLGFKKKAIRAAAPKPNCVGCERYSVCRSACGVLHSYWTPGLDDECPGFKRFIDYIYELCHQGVRPRHAAHKAC